MFLKQWLQLRDAREAFRSGQIQLAWELSLPLVEKKHPKARQLQQEIVTKILERIEELLPQEEAAWAELLAAEAIPIDHPELKKMRNRLIEQGLLHLREQFTAAQPRGCLELIGFLKQRFVFQRILDQFQAWCEEWNRALESANRGDFAQALSMISNVLGEIPEELAPGLKRFEHELQQRQRLYSETLQRLQSADANPSDLVPLADEILALAPDHRAIRRLKAEAWAKLAPSPENTLWLKGPYDPQQTVRRESSDFTPSLPEVMSRFIIWVDGVGGYLVCLGNRISFGHAGTSGIIEVPLFADLQRLHAEISRDDEGYVLESAKEMNINGRITRRHPLMPGDRITLGATCQFIFQLPVPISPTARLQLVSGHRLPIAVDGVILMAESMILGPSNHSHIENPYMDHNVILYRSQQGLGIRYPGHFTLDEEPFRERATTHGPCHFSTHLFSFSIETLASTG